MSSEMSTTPIGVRAPSRSAYASRVALLDRHEICERIATARNQAGLTQPELADVLEVHWRTIANWESRKNPTVPWNRLAEVADALGVTREWLMHGDSLPLSTPEFVQEVVKIQEQLGEILEVLRLGLPGSPPEDS